MQPFPTARYVCDDWSLGQQDGETGGSGREAESQRMHRYEV